MVVWGASNPYLPKISVFTVTLGLIYRYTNQTNSIIMVYSLIPRNKEIESFEVKSYSWMKILRDTGVGYLIGFGETCTIGSCVFESRNNKSPLGRDGYLITAAESRVMSNLSDGYVNVKRHVNNEWDMLAANEASLREIANRNGIIYQKYTDDLFLETVRDFSNFSKLSRGFRIT